MEDEDFADCANDRNSQFFFPPRLLGKFRCLHRGHMRRLGEDAVQGKTQKKPWLSCRMRDSCENAPMKEMKSSMFYGKNYGNEQLHIYL